MTATPVLEIEVRKTPSGYEAVEASGASAMSGNPYVAVVNLLDSMSEDDIRFDLTVQHNDSDTIH